MNITVEKIKYFYEKAKKAKEGITAKYNDVLNYTNVSYTISEEKSENKATREVEEVISESITTLVNFVMSNVFPRGLRWASLEINETLYNQGSVDGSQMSNEAKIKEINTDLEKVTETFFDFLNNSNFYTEASKAIRDSVVLGTGIVKIIETEDGQKPFLYKYQNLDGFYFLENMFGTPTHSFKNIFELTKEDIYELYGQSATIPEKAREENKVVDLVECVIPDEDNNKIFNFIVYDSQFETVIHEAQLKYNPFVIFRWALEGNSIWGVGLGLLGLKLFRDLENFKQLRQKQSEMIVDPPYKASGDKGLINNIILKPGHVNYGGTLERSPTEVGYNALQIEPIATSQSLIPVDQDISMTKAEIKSLFMSNPLGDLAEGKNRSATEVQARMQLFRSRWSGSYELMQQEFMVPTFMSPLNILIEKSILTLSFEKDELDFTVVKYENELSKASDIEDVQMLNTYANNAVNIANVAPQVGLNQEKTIKWISERLRVPLDIQLTEGEIIKQNQRMQDYQDQMMAQNMLVKQAQAGEQINNKEVGNAG